EGITVDEIETEADTVKISGPRTVVDAIDEYEVEVDVSEVTMTDTAIEVELTAPEGTSSVDPGNLIVDAEISVDETVLAPEDVNWTESPRFDSLLFELPGPGTGPEADMEDGFAGWTAYGTGHQPGSFNMEDFVVYVDAAEKLEHMKPAAEVHGLKELKG